MAWIESHQTLGGHLKLRRLARALNIHRAQAIGHLHYLWWWALDGAPDGDLSALTNRELAEIAEWTGDADPFVAALRESGWLDPDGSIHDWQDYAGRIVALREGNRNRQRRRRKAPTQTADQAPVTRDKPVTSRARHAAEPPPRHGAESHGGHGAVIPDGHGAETRPVTGLPNPTQPNRTQPNQTLPNPTGECVRASSGVCNATPVVPETLSPETETELSISSREPNRSVHPWPTLEEALARAERRIGATARSIGSSDTVTAG